MSRFFPVASRGRRYAALLIVLLLAGCAAEPVPPRPELVHHTVDSDGHPMAVWEKSPRTPEGVVVLLHGRTWSTVPDFDFHAPNRNLSLMDGLVDAGFATYGIDERGYGDTPRDSTGWLTPDRAAADVANVLRWVREQRPDLDAPVLFGWSYGSMLAQLTAQKSPELISRLVLFGYPTDPREEIPAQTYPARPPREKTTAEAAAEDFRTPGTISQEAIDAYVEAALKADPVRADWKNLQEWNQLDPASVSVPTLLLQGQFDPYAKTDAQAALFTGLGTPVREWVVIPGGDHASFLESPRPLFLHVLVGLLTRPD